MRLTRIRPAENRGEEFMAARGPPSFGSKLLEHISAELNLGFSILRG